MKTNDIKLTDLMNSILSCKSQLPDFQRGWVWDDDRIRALIASITNNYPVGAVMFLQYGNENVRFKYRPLEGAPENLGVVPEALILDGQQRLTSLFNAFCTEVPVKTKTSKGQKIERHYYLDIEKALDPDVDRIDAVVSVPDSKTITSNFGKTIELDLTTPEKEFENKMFPLNIVLDTVRIMKWQSSYQKFYHYSEEAIKVLTEFASQIIVPISSYMIPVITLEKETPKEAVCQVFENVNTGGVSLTVFELVTAIFAMDNFPLREDWERRYREFFNGPILSGVTATDFLIACTLLSAFFNRRTVSCKKKDVLNLSLAEYQSCADLLTRGFKGAEKFLMEERVFSNAYLPYSTQLIPLAVICALLLDSHEMHKSNVDKLRQWYWCGVFGELYGGANETRYVDDVVGFMQWKDDDDKKPKTVVNAYFNPIRLLSLQTKNSAAYKGIMALIFKNQCKDFISDKTMDFVVYANEKIDIHHIFPKDYCIKQGYPDKKWNSIVNKTPISYSTNREIGGVAPSVYLAKIEAGGKADACSIDACLETHWISPDLCRADDFDRFFVDRARKILDAIELATGKTISGRDGEDVINGFGASLL
ncbi:MAG: DUF262 domain-containing protein [Thermoguttaceae bacterium]|nr:DUF262 domain-containing protein [Thermoguttaceae bacterium]